MEKVSVRKVVMPVNEMELGIVVFTFQHLKNSVYFTNNEQDSATRVLVFV